MDSGVGILKIAVVGVGVGDNDDNGLYSPAYSLYFFRRMSL